ncbi:Peptidase S28 [Penicillium ucsense]|uniref:Peptidase S28 n=1 Tax=Penicillium ucsense TaxID=2839758 RepID=A0A8J8WGA9_9EURO|nr:Peptidase S28 [Penicillium ucsense]KAF7732975.1 Peptidase S28 [Penicillium ucsense]
MRYSSLGRMAIVLAGITGTTFGMGMTHLRRELSLSAELGISPDTMLKQRKSAQSLVKELPTDNITSLTVSIPIDHENSSVGTYENRYWVSDEYYREGGPVVLYDVGEINAETTALKNLGNSSSVIAEMLEEFGAIGIVWEHRYYGESLPFNVSIDTPPEHYKYLTNKQALADIPYFAQNFTLPGHEEDLTPESKPWVMIGGSYAGMRAAFTRDAYPDTIYAAWASSAPVEARVDMSMYFDQIYDGMVANGYLNCTKDIKAALAYIDEELSRSEESAIAIKQLFFGAGAEENNNGDFTAAVGGIFGYFQAYGLGGGEGSLGAFCDYLETDDYSKRTAGAEGVASRRGNRYVAERYATWPIFVYLINFNYGTNCRQTDLSQPLECKLNPATTDPDTISWFWQFCTEFGYFQVNNVGPHSLLSKYQSIDYQQYTCNRQFPEAVSTGLLPKSPQADQTNRETGGWTIRPSNVYWSGGQFDPWRTLSPLATEDIAPQGVKFTTDIPQCGVETAENTLFGYIMENTEHCFDLMSDFQPGEVSRGYFKEALKLWLPCFKPASHRK